MSARSRYQREFRRYVRNSGSSGTIPVRAVVVVILVVALAFAGRGHIAAAAHGIAKAKAKAGTGTGAPTAAARKAIAYARNQIGKPYLWGGTGPGAFDCSGLVMMAWLTAGVAIPRTSEQQWVSLPHIPARDARPGDLVFFPGSDGTWTKPGHVAMVLSRTKMIQAYATGFPVEVSPLNGDGAGGIVGYARPR
jgi:cell wall-associated NlpC family hydrolase